ncbi:MAG TPA: UvrB/UvrC motif-containing protein, partial [Tepidisphaeraceae bacterium]|nr:UvrB/UvrC motif-containing protein [Tepidisphaeraceae bacterium]
KARHTAASVIRANDTELDTTEMVKLLEEEMLEAARMMEFERAAQLRDKLKELQGVPTIKSGAGLSSNQSDEEREAQKIWQPKKKGRGSNRAAK